MALLELEDLLPDLDISDENAQGPATGYKERALALILEHCWPPHALLPILDTLKDIPGLNSDQVRAIP